MPLVFWWAANPVRFMKQTLIFTFLVAVMALLVGCGNKQAEYTPEAAAADDPEKAAMTQHLESMTPEQRAQYVQQNQAEVQNAYSGVKEPGATR